jgi:hypothetical protein
MARVGSPVIDQRVDQELFAHVLEEVLLSPALEHAVGDFDVAQVPSYPVLPQSMKPETPTAVVNDAEHRPSATLRLHLESVASTHASRTSRWAHSYLSS